MAAPAHRRGAALPLPLPLPPALALALSLAQGAAAQWVDASGRLRGPAPASAPAAAAPAAAAAPGFGGTAAQPEAANLNYVDDLEIWVVLLLVVAYISIALKLGKGTADRSPLQRYICCWGDLYLGRALWIFNFIFSPVILLIHAIRIYVIGTLGIYLRRGFWLVFGCCTSYYTDPEFPPQERSLGTVGGDAAHGGQGATGDPTTWVRAMDFAKSDVRQRTAHPHLHNSAMCLFEGKIEAKDILQGALGDCWLLAAMATLAEHEGLIASLFLTPEVDPRGKYTIRLFDPVHRHWKNVVIDDHVPCTPDRRAADGVARGSDQLPQTKYTRPHGREIWAMLLEKAVAKLCGSYAAIEGGITEWGIVCMTGGSAWRFESRDNGSWQRNDLTMMDDAADKRATGFRPTGEEHSSAELFDLLRHYHRHRAVLCCGGVKDAGQAQGLVPKHAFSLLQVRTVPVAWGSHEFFRFVQIRNPWGTGEWTGPWSDKSPLWQQYPWVRHALDFENSDDGAYWMQWEDFCQYWGYVGVVDCDTDIRSLQAPLHEESDPLGPLKAAAIGCTRFWCCCDGLRHLCLTHEATSERVPKSSFKQSCGLDPSGAYCRVCEYDSVHIDERAGGKLVKDPHELHVPGGRHALLGGA